MQSAHGQVFFLGGEDEITYDPSTPGTPNGRLYVGDKTGKSKCHYRINAPNESGTVEKKATGYRGFDLATLEPFDPVLYVTLGTRKLWSLPKDSVPGEPGAPHFEEVDTNGKPCVEPASLQAARTPHAAQQGVDAIKISNAADSFDLTCDGRYAVVVGSSTPTPVSLVDLQVGAEVDTFAINASGTFAAACDDGQSVLVLLQLIVSPSKTTSTIRRLTVIPPGKLNDTGEVFSLSNPDDIIFKVFAVPSSKVGLALTTNYRSTRLVSLSIPGLQTLDSVQLNGFSEVSAAVSCAGDKIYVRNGDRIEGFTLDPVTGALGHAAFLTIPGVSIAYLYDFYGNALAISRDGTRLIASEPAPSPPTPDVPASQITYFDALTGARVGTSDITGLVNPTLVATAPCCAGPGLRLGIQQLPSGLIQITSTGGPGQKYELQKSQNLVAWDKLLKLQATKSPAPYTDPNSQTNSTRFYRLKLVP